MPSFPRGLCQHLHHIKVVSEICCRRPSRWKIPHEKSHHMSLMMRIYNLQLRRRFRSNMWDVRRKVRRGWWNYPFALSGESVQAKQMDTSSIITCLKRLNMRLGLLLCNQTEPFLARVLTCDEKWLLYSNPKRSHHWFSITNALPQCCATQFFFRF